MRLCFFLIGIFITSGIYSIPVGEIKNEPEWVSPKLKYRILNQESKTFESKSPSLGFQKDPVIIELPLENHTEIDKEIIVEIKNPQIQNIRLYLLKNPKPFISNYSDEDNRTFINSSGSSKKKEGSFHLKKNQIFYLNIPPKSELHYEIEISSPTSINLPVVLYSKSSFQESILKETFFYAFIFGILLFALLFSATFYFILKDKLYIYLSLFCLIGFCSILYISGYAYNIIGVGSLIRGRALLPFISFLNFIIFISLMRTSLDQKFLHEILFRFSNYILLIFSILALFTIIFEPKNSFYLVAIAIIVIFLYSLASIWSGFKNKNKAIFHFIPVVLAYIISTSIRYLEFKGLVSFQIELTVLFMFFLIIFLSISISFQYISLRFERDAWQKNFHLSSSELSEIKKEIQAARTIQEYLIPQRIPNQKNLTLETYYRPANEVSGDFFDFVETAEGVGIFIADVTGHGISAAMFATVVKHSFQSIAKTHSNEPSKLLSILNHSLYTTLGKMQLTACYVFISNDNSTLKISRCGHPYPLLYNLENFKLTEIKPKGLLIGYLENQYPQEETFQITSSSRLILYTDGLIELKNENEEEFGEDRLYGFLNRKTNSTSKKVVEELKLEIFDFADDKNGLIDDITLLIIDFTPLQ